MAKLAASLTEDQGLFSVEKLCELLVQPEPEKKEKKNMRTTSKSYAILSRLKIF